VETFPFTENEWAAVKQAILPIVNATSAEDAVLQDSHFVALLDILAALRERYGEHPVLLETEADFTENDEERLQLYGKAIRLADANRLSTLSIRLSLAELLLGRRQRAAARVELLACKAEASDADDSDRASWEELARASGHA
jgi:hypothetical protein